jgi:5-formyltetrahydrofolate cyclo-ligase
LILERCDPAAGLAVGARIAASMERHPPKIAAGFFPLGRELDITPLLHSWRAAGHIVALPRTPAIGLPLTFHRWDEGDALRRERFGTMTSDGPEVTPDVLLVPLLAFDRRGHRLGYGGGFYDRTIAALPGVRTIGCAYAALELPEVPSGATDITLQAIATEHEIITLEP